jgi:NADP-dependent 3-hydroxy acid dehydrogenase YdfG
MSFDEQRVVIVGGSAGIGEAAARAFAAAGARVTITGRAKQRLDAAAQRIGYPAEVRELDATDSAAVDEFFGSAQAFDHLVLAASPGAVGSGPFADLDESALRQAFDGKFFAYVKVLKAAQPNLRADGSVTIVSAVSARAAYPGAAGLAAVNGALEAMCPRSRWNSPRCASTPCRPASSTRTGGTRCRKTSAQFSSGPWPPPARYAGSARPRMWPEPSSTWPEPDSSPARYSNAPAART